MNEPPRLPPDEFGIVRWVVERLRDAPRTYGDLAKVVGGNLARNGLRGVFKLLVAGFLTPAGLGVLRTLSSVFKIVTSLADLALDYAVITFVSAATQQGAEDERRRLFGAVLCLKLWVSAAVLVVGVALAPWIAAAALGDPSLTGYTRLVFVAVGGQLLWRYLSGCLSAGQEFGRLALFLITAPLLMLGAGGAFMIAGRFDVRVGILIDLFAPTAVVALWWPVIARRFPLRPVWDTAVFGRVLRFSRWVWLSNVVSANRNHINPLLLKHPALSGSLALGEVRAGLYGFGNDLANEITILSQSLLTVLLPKASRKLDRARLRRFVLRSYGHLLVASVPLILVVFTVRPLVLLLGRLAPNYLEYLPAVPVFAILYLGSLFSLASVPMRSALYSLEVPQFETYTEVVSGVILLVSSILVIPRFGMEGAAIVVFAQRLLVFLAIVIYGWGKLRVESGPPAA